MTGFYISNIKSSAFIEKDLKNITEINYKDFTIRRKTGEKFKKDKLFFENEVCILILEGVILNFREMKKVNNCKSMEELCLSLIKEKGDNFHDQFIGNFAGALYYKEQDKWVIFTNKYSSKQLFYYYSGNVFIVASLITDIVKALQENYIEYNFNKEAAYLMLTYGYMGTDDTFVSEIKKIEAGHYLVFENGKFNDVCYHHFTNNKYDLKNASEEEIIEGIDLRFRKAIKREYEKDKEEGYNVYLRTLTGGTDSRAGAFVSNSLGYRNVVNLTYGVPGHPDEKIAREISTYMGNNIIYMSNLPTKDETNFLFGIDNAVYKSQGLTYYFEVAQGSKETIRLDSNSFGLVHGGGFSEAFMTTGYLKNPLKEPPKKPLHTYCSLVLDKCPRGHLKKYENEDIYSIYSIFFNKHNPGGRNLIDADDNTVFPGLDYDLVEYCLSIPLELRKNYYIYHKWLFAKYPDSKQFKLEKLNARVNDGPIKKWWGKINRYGSPSQYLRCSKDPLPTKIREKYNLDKKIKPSIVALMPFDYWYDSSLDAQKYMKNYLEENIVNPIFDKELQKDLVYVYENALARPKSMVITVVAAARMLFPMTIKEKP